MPEYAWRFIPHDKRERAILAGYMLESEMASPHGDYSALMVWICSCGRQPPAVR